MQHTNPIEALFERARTHRIPMAAVCREAEVAQTTPSRWRKKKNGATVETLTKLDRALSRLIEERTA